MNIGIWANSKKLTVGSPSRRRVVLGKSLGFLGQSSNIVSVWSVWPGFWAYEPKSDFAVTAYYS